MAYRNCSETSYSHCTECSNFYRGIKKLKRVSKGRIYFYILAICEIGFISMNFEYSSIYSQQRTIHGLIHTPSKTWVEFYEKINMKNDLSSYFRAASID